LGVRAARAASSGHLRERALRSGLRSHSERAGRAALGEQPVSCWLGVLAAPRGPV